MAGNTNPIFPAVPYIATANMCAVSACTTRGPTASAGLAAANIIALTVVSTNGLRVDRIQVKGASTSFTAPTVAQIMGIWEFDGTTAWLIDELLVSVITPSTTVASFIGQNVYNTTPYNVLVIPPTHTLYVSNSITTTASTTALIATLFGGTY